MRADILGLEQTDAEVEPRAALCDSTSKVLSYELRTDELEVRVRSGDSADGLRFGPCQHETRGDGRRKLTAKLWISPSSAGIRTLRRASCISDGPA